MDLFRRHSLFDGHHTPVHYPPGMDPCILGYTNGTFPNGTLGAGHWNEYGVYEPSDGENLECQKYTDPWLESAKYGHYASYLLVACLMFVMALGMLKRMDSAVRSSGFISPLHPTGTVVTLFRAISYPKLSWKFISIPQVGPLSLLVVYFAFSMAYTWGVRPYYRPKEFGVPPLGIRSEWVATAIVPWMYALSMKRNFVRFLTGGTIESTQVLHRWSPWICLYFSMVHTVAMVIRALSEKPWRATWDASKWYWNGTAALVPLCWLCFTGFPIVRHYLYRTWFATHLLAALLFLIFMYIHCDNLLDSWTYLHFTVVIWGGSIIVQHGIALYQSMQTRATVEQLCPNILRIRIPVGNEKGCAKISSWSPGQHCQLRFWTLGLYFANPFSVCSLPSDKELVFVVRTAHPQGITRKLFKAAANGTAESPTTLPVLVDGPYGGVGDVGEGVRSSDSALLIAGGVGITYVISVFKDLIKCACDSQACKGRGDATSRIFCHNVRLIWTVKSIDVLEAFAHDLRQVMEQLPTFVSLDLHITGAKDESSSDIESSSSNNNEKESFKNLPIKFGRPDIKKIVGEEIMTRDGKLGVIVCGPNSLTKDVRSQVAKSQWKILQKRTQVSEVELWDEEFSY